jgi:hypothetical protein
MGMVPCKAAQMLTLTPWTVLEYQQASRWWETIAHWCGKGPPGLGDSSGTAHLKAMGDTLVAADDELETVALTELGG